LHAKIATLEPDSVALEREHSRKLTMTTRELLICEINHAPDNVLKVTLHYLQTELQRRGLTQHRTVEQTTGPYADYWNQIIGVFANEELDRPAQGTLEQREGW
jgi:hypothetical protein